MVDTTDHHASSSSSSSASASGVMTYSQEIARSALALPIDARRGIVQALLESLPRNDVWELFERYTTALQKDIVGSLPPELAFIILSKLDLEDLLRCSWVSRGWNRLCNEQALWALLCAQHRPPIKPLDISWADLTRHRRRLQLASPITTSRDRSYDQDERDTYGTYGDAEDEDADEHDMSFGDTLSAQGGLGGGGGLDPLGMEGGLRRSVWERGGAGAGAGLPTHLRYATQVEDLTAAAKAKATAAAEPVMLSHLGIPSARPLPNYKHLYIVHDILENRMTAPRPPVPSHLRLHRHSDPQHTSFPTYQQSSHSPSPVRRSIAPLPKAQTIDAISSVKSGGLSGHTEAIYSLSLLHHPMRISMLQAYPDPVQTSAGDASTTRSVFESLLNLTAIAPPSHRPSVYHAHRERREGQPMTVDGREWLLSGSRDKTLRLWQLDSGESRVVKIFSGGHTGSVLTHSVVKVPTDLSVATRGLPASPRKGGVTVLAVSGGSDGKLCLWDVEGDGSPLTVVQAHNDSVLCVRADEERVVTCSKDKSIKLFNVRTLSELLVIEGGNDDPDNHRGAVNAVGLSSDFIVSASGDKSIRLWSFDGQLLTRVEAHHRGIASIDFLPAPPAPGPALVENSTADAGSADDTTANRSERGRERYRGKIVTGASDASMKIFDVIELPDHPRPHSHLPNNNNGKEESQTNGHSHSNSHPHAHSRPLSPEISQRDINMTNTEGGTSIVLRQRARNTAWCVCALRLGIPLSHREGERERERGRERSQCRCDHRGHTDLIRSVHLNEKVGVIISGSYDSTVKVWNSTTGRLIADLTGNQKSSRIFAVVGDRTKVVSSGLDCKIQIWDFAQGLDTSFIEP